MSKKYLNHSYKIVDGVYVLEPFIDPRQKPTPDNVIRVINEIYSYDDNKIKGSPIVYLGLEGWVGFKQDWSSNKCSGGISTKLDGSDLFNAIDQFLRYW
jgi:hypothetical protein